jgi:hypothetical protein
VVVTPERVLLIRRIGGIVLMLAGAYFLIGPFEILIGGTHGAAENSDVRHHILDAMIYQLTLGGVLILFGSYFLLKTPPKKAT